MFLISSFVFRWDYYIPERCIRPHRNLQTTRHDV